MAVVLAFMHGDHRVQVCPMLLIKVLIRSAALQINKGRNGRGAVTLEGKYRPHCPQWTLLYGLGCQFGFVLVLKMFHGHDS